jgi:D-lactate dehydrogenase (cytochrome)
MEIANQSAIEQALAELRVLLGDRVTAAEATRQHHSHGESSHPPALPDLVCFPQSTAEVSEIMRASARHGLAVVPFGAGTSLEGHVHALRGGISVDMRQMNRVLRVSVEDLDATVEAGISRLQLMKALENTGLTFAVDPGADATIGGMASTRALWQHAGERAGTDGGAGRWARDPHRYAGAKVERGIRPDAAVCGRGRNAGRHHRGYAAPARAA